MEVYSTHNNYSGIDKLVYEGYHKIINDSLYVLCQTRAYKNWFNEPNTPHIPKAHTVSYLPCNIRRTT
jgi:hypothetical protein